MAEVIVGVALTALLTALLGGLLVPYVKGRIDRRRERFESSVALVETLATSLWTYWKLALRIAYYGRQEPPDHENLVHALELWDSDESWLNGCQIQIQVSRSKRLLPSASYTELVKLQEAVVDFLDRRIDELRRKPAPRTEWAELYSSLMTEKRLEIDTLLAGVTAGLRL
jgi:hypothetical protein